MLISIKQGLLFSKCKDFAVPSLQEDFIPHIVTFCKFNRKSMAMDMVLIRLVCSTCASAILYTKILKVFYNILWTVCYSAKNENKTVLQVNVFCFI